jgi:hypothetical protein
MGNININISDKRNNTTAKTIPFIRYERPRIDIVSVDNGIIDNDTIIVLPPKTIITFKAVSVIGLKEIRYNIDNSNEQVIQIPNNAKEYTFTIEINV